MWDTWCVLKNTNLPTMRMRGEEECAKFVYSFETKIMIIVEVLGLARCLRRVAMSSKKKRNLVTSNPPKCNKTFLISEYTGCECCLIRRRIWRLHDLDSHLEHQFMLSASELPLPTGNACSLLVWSPRFLVRADHWYWSGLVRRRTSILAEGDSLLGCCALKSVVRAIAVLKMEAVRTSEMTGGIFETTQLNIPEDSQFCTTVEDLQSHHEKTQLRLEYKTVL